MTIGLAELGIARIITRSMPEVEHGNADAALLLDVFPVQYAASLLFALRLHPPRQAARGVFR